MIKIAQLFPGDRVCIIGGNGDRPWLHIQYTRDGRNWTGWAHGRYLKTDAGRSNAPIPSAPPPVAAEPGPYEVKVDPPICEITIVTKVYPAGPPAMVSRGTAGAERVPAASPMRMAKAKAANIPMSRRWNVHVPAIESGFAL